MIKLGLYNICYYSRGEHEKSDAWHYYESIDYYVSLTALGKMIDCKILINLDDFFILVKTKHWVSFLWRTIRSTTMKTISLCGALLTSLALISTLAPTTALADTQNVSGGYVIGEGAANECGDECHVNSESGAAKGSNECPDCVENN